MGKTFLLRLLLLAAALDPRAELRVYDLKGTGDLDPLQPVCHRLRVRRRRRAHRCTPLDPLRELRGAASAAPR